MDNVHEVDLIQPCYDLVEEPASLFLWHPATCHNVVEQFTTAAILHDQVELPRSFNDLIQLDHMWMPDELEDMNLASDPLHISYIHDAFLLQYLHSNLLTSENVSSQLHLTKGSLANGLT
jgi:hypothetical protein